MLTGDEALKMLIRWSLWTLETHSWIQREEPSSTNVNMARESTRIKGISTLLYVFFVRAFLTELMQSSLILKLN